MFLPLREQSCFKGNGSTITNFTFPNGTIAQKYLHMCRKVHNVNNHNEVSSVLASLSARLDLKKTEMEIQYLCKSASHNLVPWF